MAAISVAAFVTFGSVSGHVPKSLAYNPNLLYTLYSEAPFISQVAGVVSSVLAIVALRGSSRGLQVALIGLAIGIVVFFIVMVSVAPALIEGEGVATAGFPLLVLSAPVVGIAGVAIAGVAVLSRLRGVSGLRLAIASVVMGGVVTAYWLFNWVIGNLNGE